MPCERHRAPLPLIAPLTLVLAALGVLFSAPSKGSAQAEHGTDNRDERSLDETQTEEDPRALFLEGQRLYSTGQYEEAVELWTRAYEISGLVALQYNIAQAYGRLGKVVEEREALARFILAEDTPEDLKAVARERLAALDQRIARTALIIDGDREGAEVFVNEKHVGALPLPRPVHVEPGIYRVTGRLEGFAEASANARVTPGEQLRVRLEFARLELGRETGPRITPIAWGLWAGGGATLVTGAILGGLALGKSSGAERGSADADSASKLALGADITIAVGAAALIGGVITQIIYRKRAKSEREPKLAFEPRLGGAALTLQGNY